MSPRWWPRHTIRWRSPMTWSAMTLCSILCLSIFANLSPYEPDQPHLEEQRLAPSWEHWFGTDDLGRDTLTRSFYAGRISLGIAAVSTATALLLGLLVGSVAGFKGGRIDAALMGIVDVALAIPIFLVLLFLAATTGGNFWMLSLVIGFATWMPIARLARTLVLSLRDQEFVQAAQVLGMSDRRIVVRHILPNATAPLLIAAALAASQAILVESALSFLGFGVQTPTPTWGNMLRDAQDYLMTAPWNAVFPGMFIFLTVLALNVLGDALRDYLDPRMRSTN